MSDRNKQKIIVEVDLITHEVTIKGADVDDDRTKGSEELHKQIDDIARLFGRDHTTHKSKPVDKQKRSVITRQETYQER